MKFHYLTTPAISRLAFAAALAAFSSPMVAQNVPDLRPGNWELGLYGGASYGIDKFRPMGGVNLSYSLPKLLLPYVEFSYFPEFFIRRDDTATDTTTFGARLVDFHGGVHVRFIQKESKVVPYGVIGFGVINAKVNGTTQAKAVAGLQPPPPTRFSFTSTDPAVNFGAGIRYYATSRFGFRVEAKVYRPVSGRLENFFSKYEGGIFFQF
jgi:hypothetical protein